MIEYENILATMQNARDRCDATIKELQADVVRKNIGLDAAVYTALETGHHEASQRQPGLSIWEATVVAHSKGEIDLAPYFREHPTLARRVRSTVKAVQHRTLLGLMKPFGEMDDTTGIVAATKIPESAAAEIKQAYDNLRTKGTKLTIEANGKPLIRPTPARVLLPRQEDGYISQQFYDQHLAQTDIGAYKEVLTNAVQDILLTGLFPRFFRDEVDNSLLEEMVHNPMVSQAMPKIYAMAKEISEAVKEKPSIWERLKRTWH
ncbi:hypothetical protein KY329_01075 [Candidatus Woesearchaeota archaeon]|nr:hypothetical protein [Candidatus Woesearchaeota archaeon]